MKLTKKIELLLSNKMDDVLEKIEETNDIINKKTDMLNNKIKECYDLEFKMNELNILNNQKIVEKHDYQEEDNNNEISPITENYYMSPVQNSSKNSNILSLMSRNTISDHTSNREDLNDNIDNLNLSENGISDNMLFDGDDDLLKNNVNFLKNNVNYCNIIVNNKNSENDSTRIKTEDRIEEL